MKLWKWILGVLALLGGAAAVASTQGRRKKEYDKRVKDNNDKIKEVWIVMLIPQLTTLVCCECLKDREEY